MADYTLIPVRNPTYDGDGKPKYADKVAGNIYYLPERFCVGDYEDLALLPNKAYSEIFGVKRSEDILRRKRLAIVKITYGRISIYRAYRGANIGFGNIGLTDSSIRYFGSDNKDFYEKKFTISRGCWFPYYWNHPFHATRISCRLGVISVGLGILSLVLAILSLF